jgi:trigger factor
MAEQETPQPDAETEATALGEAAGEKEEKLSCSVDISESGPCKKKIKLVIPREEIDKQLNQKYRELMPTAEVPGFRKGRAPRRLVEKRFGSDIGTQTKLELLSRAFQQIEEGQDFEALGEPDFDPEKIELPETGDFTFEYEIEVRPQFELPVLEGIRVEKPLFEINEARINEAVKELQERYGRTEDVHDGAAAGDSVIADVTLQVAGVEPPETIEGQPLWLGSETVLGVPVKVAEALAGIKPGESRTLEATVPEDHAKEECRGKPATLTIIVRSVRRMAPAALDSSLFERLGVADEAEMRRQVEEYLEQQSDREIKRLMEAQVREHLARHISFELPAGLAARYAGRVLARQYYELLERGVPQERINENLERLRTASNESAARELKMSFIMEALAKQLGVTVAEEEVNSYIAQLAGRYRRRPERMREEWQREGRLDEMKERIRDQRALDQILEMAEVVDVAPPAASDPQAQASKGSAEQPASAAADNAGTPATESEAKPAKRRSQVKRKPPKADE